MDSQFSPRIKDIIGYSREEAIRLGNDFIGQEHLFLGILRDGEGIASDIIENLGVDLKEIKQLIERKIIEVAPLAFMRGRTLNDSFIILDEAQNTTTEQIKMFLTRVGFGSTAVITGDITQIDLPTDKMSGLKHVLKVLDKVEGISFTFFCAKDIVRHPLVQRIVVAYENYERAHG